MGEAGAGEEQGRMDSDGTDNTVWGEREERWAPGKPPEESQDREGDDCHSREDTKEAACGKDGWEDHCDGRHVAFLIRSYPRLGKDALFQRIDKLDDTTCGILGDQEKEYAQLVP